MMFMRGSPSWQGRANSESLTTLGLVPLVVRILVHLLAELARLYGGTGSKSLRLVSTRNAFFGSILFLFNFRESVNGRALATDASPERYKNSVYLKS